MRLASNAAVQAKRSMLGCAGVRSTWVEAVLDCNYATPRSPGAAAQGLVGARHGGTTGKLGATGCPPLETFATITPVAPVVESVHANPPGIPPSHLQRARHLLP